MQWVYTGCFVNVIFINKEVKREVRMHIRYFTVCHSVLNIVNMKS